MRNLDQSPRPTCVHRGVVMWGGVLLMAAAVPSLARAQFQALVKELPRSANAVLLLNIERAKESPLGVREGWKGKLEKAFQDGLIRVPPQAQRAVLAAQFDFETMSPTWESAVMDLSGEVSPSAIAKTYLGQVDRVEDLDAVVLPKGTYIVKLHPQIVAAVEPASRQFVSRWLREIRSATGPALSPYLERAAGYSDKAGSEIIMALDLDGAFSDSRITSYLRSKEWLQTQGSKRDQLASLLHGVQGIRLGVKISEQPIARVAVDFSSDTSAALPEAKQLLLEALADSGMQIDDLEDWKADARGTEIGLQGTLSREGLRQVLSIMQSPMPSVTEGGDTTPSPAAQRPSASAVATASQEHFKAVVGFLNNLKLKKREIKTFAQHAVWCDRYASKIEKLPILNVDKELIEYSAFVAQMLRQVSGTVRTTGIRTGVQQSAVSTTAPDVYSYGYANGWYGGYGYARYAPRADMRYEAAQRRIIRKEGEGAARITEQEIKAQIIAATNDIRMKMTEKYKVEFEF